MEITAEMRSTVPEALYGCETFECATEISYPANLLSWHPRDECFYCEGCHINQSKENDPLYSDCPSLAEVLAAPA